MEVLITLYPFDRKQGHAIQTDSPDTTLLHAFIAHLQIPATLATVANTTGIHAAITDNATQQIINTSITNPSVPRNITATAGGTGANITAVQVIIAGTSYANLPITETLQAFTAATPGSVAGSKAFKTVTSITVPINGTGVTTAIGFGEILGLPYKLAHNTVLLASLNNVKEAIAPTVVASSTAIESNTMKLNSTLNASIVDAYLIV